MDIDRIPVLMAFFWVGFSLAYVVLAWFTRIKPQFDFKDTTHIRPVNPVSYPIRLTLAAIGLVGAFGAAGLAGEYRGPGTDVSFLVGLITGVFIAYKLHMDGQSAAQRSNL